MSNLKSNLKVIMALAFGLVLFTGCSSDDEKPPESNEPIVKSLFEESAEGWKIVGDAQGGYVEPTYFPDGGMIGGYIYADDDVAGGVWFFAAPESYIGDKLEYYGATLNFSLFQDSYMSNQFEFDDIVFRNGELQITYVHGSANYPTKEWTSYAIPIKAGNGWLLGDYDSDVMATETDMKEVLSNVTEFWIRGEFESGPDAGGLDKVEITN